MRIDLLITHLRVCLEGAKYGSVGTPPAARVFAAADFDEILKGEPKPADLPAWFVIPGPTVVTNPVENDANFTEITQMETVMIALVLDTSDDEWGHNSTLQLHDAKFDLLACMHGHNPQIQAECAGLTYGYCTREFAYNGDVLFDIDPNRLVWQFQFVISSELDQEQHGIGGNNACNIEDFLRIFTDIAPTQVSDDQNPALKSELELPQ